MVSATWRNISRASPAINKMGKKTETVVSVDAMTASPTARVPAAAALRGSMPAARQVKMLSKMTMELSTIMPTAMTSPASETIFKVSPEKYMAKKVAMTEIGMAVPMMPASFSWPKMAQSTSTARSPP
ncbi:hypothetical protein SDC9_113729 [bioreactor metagenome]|uniref:Uncharacterized protein n=1 Tax=bioreactor metagenome TaxID=1076179 RepID=A0A645BNJ7_9ZZZZ